MPQLIVIYSMIKNDREQKLFQSVRKIHPFSIVSIDRSSDKRILFFSAYSHLHQELFFCVLMNFRYSTCLDSSSNRFQNETIRQWKQRIVDQNIRHFSMIFNDCRKEMGKFQILT